MTKDRHDVIVFVSSLVALVSIALFAATGGRWYSRHPDPALSAMNAQEDLSALFADEADEAGASEVVASVYAFGLFPGGPNPIDMWAVATVGGPAAAGAGLAHLLYLRRRKSASTDTQES